MEERKEKGKEVLWRVKERKKRKGVSKGVIEKGLCRRGWETKSERRRQVKEGEGM